jgi:hypothetical protein
MKDSERQIYLDALIAIRDNVLADTDTACVMKLRMVRWLCNNALHEGADAAHVAACRASTKRGNVFRVFGLMAVAALVLAFLVGCGGDASGTRTPTQEVLVIPGTNLYDKGLRVIHDDKRSVTCYYTEGGYNGTSPALSCVPDLHMREAAR